MPVLALLLLLIALAACSSPPDTPQAPALQQATEAAGAPSTVPSPTSSSVPARATGEVPEDPEQEWVTDRIGAVVSLYDLTPEGVSAIKSLDLRWMQDQPGFFGSFGFKSWTGVGEARPIGVMHEISHAYWGLFPVTGFPQLSWDVPRGDEISPAMKSYHKDVLEFMKQPPDRYELLRNHLRNLPELSAANTAPLLHTIEADAIYTTVGDLELLPPILRKYWDRFLEPGPFHSWDEAFRWYQSLAGEDRTLANGYIAFEHFDLSDYGVLKAREPTLPREDVNKVLQGEERQRLRDFVELFDLLVAATTQHREDFRFWRGYLRDKVELHGKHPQLVASLPLPRSEEIVSALDFLVELRGKGPEEKADLAIQELVNQPFLAHFIPTLDDLTLLKLFTSDAELPEGATLKGTANFVESLKAIAPHIDTILEAGRRDSSRGAEELASYLADVDFEEKEPLRLFFEVLQGSDGLTASEVVAALEDSLLRRLLVAVPAKLRGLLEPDRFLKFLDITPESSQEEIGQGIREMIAYPSGNFRIDEPFLNEMYRVVATRGRNAPLETLDLIAISPFPLERFIRLHPQAAVDILAQNLDTTTRLVKASDPVTFPPARLVYRLIYADPQFAALVVERLDEQGEAQLVLEALAHLAFDYDRLESFPSLPISLERDGQFLERLRQVMGEMWLEDRIGDAVLLYGERAERSEVQADFVPAYEKTLKAAAAELEDIEARNTLEGIIGRMFR